jgi:hypothetical protein
MNKATFYKSGKYFKYRFHRLVYAAFLMVKKAPAYIAISLIPNTE